MTKLEELQEKKVKVASELLSRFEDMYDKIPRLEALGKESLVRDWFTTFSAGLKRLADILEDQEVVCKSDACSTVVQAQLAALKGDAKQVGLIRHCRLVARGELELNSKMVRSVLGKLVSQKLAKKRAA